MDTRLNGSETPVDIYCPDCGYDLRGIPEGACPECGFRYDRQAVRSLNRHWALNRLGELQYAAGVQAAVFAMVLPWLVLSPRGTLLGVCWFAIFYLLTRSWNSTGELADASYQVTHSVAFWATFVAVLVVLTIASVRRGDFAWPIVFLPGIISGVVAWQRYRAARGLNRDSKLAPAVAGQLRRWSRANAVMTAVSLCALVGAMLAWG